MERQQYTRENLLHLCSTQPAATVDLIVSLIEQVKILQARIQELEIALKKNSQNSHKPPSSDGYKRNIHSSAPEKNKRSNGGQAGHKGTTLRKTTKVDHVVEHPVNTCQRCGASLDHVAAHEIQTRQVFDLPPLHIEVTEHQSEVKRCPCCNHHTVGAFPAGVSKAAQYGSTLKGMVLYIMHHHLIPYERAKEFVSDLFGCTISEGTLNNWTAEAATTLEVPETQIKEQLQCAPVLCADETGMFCENKLQWIHVTSTELYTHYGIHHKRGNEAMDANGILPNVQGRIVHDFWEPYARYDHCSHAYCNAHIIRELRALHELYPAQRWIPTLVDLLFAINTKKEMVKQFSKNMLTRYRKKFNALIATGLRHHPKSRGEPHRRGRIKQSKARNLVERLRSHADECLAFMYDPRVPFTNNLAESDLRMVKVKQKISGTFRSQHGARFYCRIRSYVSTMKKQGVNILLALSSIFMGIPLSPIPDLR